MQKRMMQIALLFGVLSIPSFASADGGLLGSTLSQPTEIVNTVTEEVANTTSQAEEALPIKAEQGESLQPVTAIVKTVTETTQKVTKAVESEKPIVEVKVSTSPSVKVNTGVVEAEVSKTPKVKVDTSIAKVEVADTVAVDTEVVQAEVKRDQQISVQTPVVDVDSSVPTQSTTDKEILVNPVPETEVTELPVEKLKQEVPPVMTNEIVKPDISKQRIIDEEQNDALNETSRNERLLNVEIDKPKNALSIPMKMPTNYEQVQATPTFQSGPSTLSNSSLSSGSMTFALLDGYDVSNQNEPLAYFGKTRLFFDQWLNAPPSQPPQHSLFKISRI
ncbi:hypothetical protein [Paenisporosarcina sp. NPDC076898]|uniref:hypothetical protein n=1 Tax=unclassified Paenisporosarcina TaxID=2642018 RepID=UPI003CFBDA43